MRVISLVPSLTDAVAALGAADVLVGVTRYCVSGAPAEAERVGGTKNPDVQRIIALRPDLVLANTEENRPGDLDRLRQAGIAVEESYPRSVRDCVDLTRRLGAVLDLDDRAESLARTVEEAIAAASWPAEAPRVMALTLIWRKPWMGVGPGTYVDDLLHTCGFASVLAGWQPPEDTTGPHGGVSATPQVGTAGFEDPYPKLDPSFVLGADVVLLPSEPYAFSEDDLPAVADLVGADVPTRFVDGQALTWHGPRTADAITTFSALARDLAGLAGPA